MANARLIAAAPDMEIEIERLKKINTDLLEALKFYMRGHRCEAIDECPGKNMALQAISRAEKEV